MNMEFKITYEIKGQHSKELVGMSTQNCTTFLRSATRTIAS